MSEPLVAPTYHTPVMLREAVDGMNVSGRAVCVDLTFGGGGHSREILSRLGPDGRLFAFDRDEDARRNLPDDPRLTFVWSDFRYLLNFMRYYKVEGVDAVLADLGVSSHHFDDPSRGFSFRFNGPLDMRMNRHAELTAAEVVNTYGETALADIFRLYGELKNGRQIAAAIVRARADRPITTIDELTGVLSPLMAREHAKKDMARAFQALRMEVNGELDALREMLAAAVNVLRPGGRLVVITYHSLEDRLVKNVIKTGNAEGRVEKDFFGHLKAPFRAVMNKPLTPSDDEVAANPRSRSAKLRVAERLTDIENEEDE